MIQLNDLKVAYSNEETALLDMGGGIGCLQFRSKGNSISASVREFIVEMLEHELYEFDGIIIASQNKHFSVGANLVNMKNNIDAKNFTAMENNVRSFQTMTTGIKYSRKPIVAAPYRTVLGGGLEVVLHSSCRVALQKSYMGLAESGVGLLPGGGGTKCTAMLLNGLTGQALEDTLVRLFDKLLFGKVSKNAEDAKTLMYLQEDDMIVTAEEDLIAVAKAKCLDLIQGGYQPPEAPQTAVLPGKEGYDLLMRHSQTMREAGEITAYDFEIGKKIALILAGSSTEGPRKYTEQEILDQERRCFVELTQSEGTYQRIEYFLRTNEKLRN